MSGIDWVDDVADSAGWIDDRIRYHIVRTSRGWTVHTPVEPLSSHASREQARAAAEAHYQRQFD